MEKLSERWSMPKIGVPGDVAVIRKAITAALKTPHADNGKVGDSRFGVYAFFDYDGEPIYVGQTREKLRVRILRHLTNQRTDAVAMNVLDPFEVAEIEMWPLWELKEESKAVATQQLNSAEYTVFQRVLSTSSFGAVLNEKDMVSADPIELPVSVRARIPESIYEARKHPDIRIARRAATIANLAKVISEREVSPGLRRTLVTQARRLERLASQRFADFADTPIPTSGEEE
jgi:GIY-YIG catalytic domain